MAVELSKKSPDWDDVESWTDFEALRRSSAKTTWRAFALNVGQDQSGEKISAWKTNLRGLSAATWPWMCLCQEMREAWWLGCCGQEALCHSREEPFSHRGRAVSVMERDVVREDEGRRKARQVL